jgi:molybdopterin synthase catalytic subunit
VAVVETALFRITTERIDPEAVRSLVEHDGAGAIVLFHGVVRNRALSGRQVTHLDYEAYPEMAEEKMSEIGREIKKRYDVKQVAIVHRVGRLALGEASVVIAVSSARRRSAFEASEYAIDRLKEIVPIWKKEIGPDGQSWVE